jgi:hypothetical protein
MRSLDSQAMMFVQTQKAIYAGFHPWWLALLSGFVVNPDVEYIEGFLLPGFCPYYPQFDVKETYTFMQEAIKNISYPEGVFIYIEQKEL